MFSNILPASVLCYLQLCRSGDGLSLYYIHKLLVSPVFITILHYSQRLANFWFICHLSYKFILNCLLNYVHIAMHRFIGHLFKLLLSIFQASSLIQFLSMSCPFLIMEHIQDFVFNKYFVSLLFSNMYQYPIVNTSFKILGFFFPSVKKTASHPLFIFESNVHYGGSNISRIVSPTVLKSRLIQYDKCGPLNPLARYCFVKYVLNIKFAKHYVNDDRYVLCRFTLSEVTNWLNIPDISMAAKRHGISFYHCQQIARK